MTPLTLALDWTPNINHIGFFVAQHQGFYQEEELEVTFVDPAASDYGTTPAKRLERGTVDLALCPTESLISYRTKANPFPIVAIATLLQEDLSAIAVREDSGINRPADLDGRSYASYQARYEDEIVRQMIRKDGGRADLKLDYPKKLGIWNTLVEGTHDATWVFTNWEGAAAGDADPALRYFKLMDYDIPYGYSPVIATGIDTLDEKREALERFLAATKRGYLFTEENPGEAVSILRQHVPEKDRDVNLKRALALTTPYLGDPHTWGRMDDDRMERFVAWIYEHGLETQRVSAGDLYTNELLS